MFTDVYASKKFVVLSTDANHDYEFYAPLSALMWLHSAYAPHMILVGEKQDWFQRPSGTLVMSKLEELGARVRFCSVPEGYRASTTAQLCRLYAAAHEADSDYLLTSDIDMWPLSTEFFHRDGGDLQVFFANAYGAQERYPISYLGAKVPIWREIMSMNTSGVSEHVKACLDSNLGRAAESGRAWDFDEDYFSQRFKSWGPSRGDRTLLVKREGCDFGSPKGRIDRGCWDRSFNAFKDSGGIDAHLVRPGYNDNWNKVMPILAKRLDAHWLAWAMRYRGEYTASRAA